MQIMIANGITGEVIEWRSELGWKDSTGLKSIRGVIRQWMSHGLKYSDFIVLKWGNDNRLWQYLREYAWEKHLVTCDICDVVQPAENINIIEDSHEVCLAVVCNKCS